MGDPLGPCVGLSGPELWALQAAPVFEVSSLQSLTHALRAGCQGWDKAFGRGAERSASLCSQQS